MAIIQAEAKGKAGLESPGNYSENGLIYQSCLKKFEKAKDSLQNLGDEMIKAIEKRIWLGFLHPQSGQFCSFIHKDEDGNIDESISFKLWLASDPKVGGLGISELSTLDSMLRGNQKAMNLLLPMLTDGDSIRQANQILASQGKPPIIKFCRQKEYQLKKIASAPEHLRIFIQLHDLPRASCSRIINKYESLFEELENFHIEIEEPLNAIISKYRKPADKIQKRQILAEIEQLLGIDHQILKLDISDPSQLAQKLSEHIPDKEKIKELISQLELILSQA